VSDTDRANLTARLGAWARGRFGPQVEVDKIHGIDGDVGDKGFGYANVLRVELRNAEIASVVLHVARRGGFGHDTLADRAHEAFLPWQTFGGFPHHVPALDVGYLDAEGALVSAAPARDFYLVTAYAEGEPYFHDLQRIAEQGHATREDEDRARRLAKLLADAHHEKKDAPDLWQRRLRDLTGHHECIAGIVDSYDGKTGPELPGTETLRRIEHRVLEHRHRLKSFAHRLSRVHGDFHPWNILFHGEGSQREVMVLDRSRGAYGEPADDLTALSINYLFFALRHGPQAAAPLRALHRHFYDAWLSLTGDREVLEVAQPYLVFRALVVASPVWYPDLPAGMRARLFELIDAVLDMRRLDLDKVERFFTP
jgi:hypothetical protein